MISLRDYSYRYPRIARRDSRSWLYVLLRQLCTKGTGRSSTAAQRQTPCHLTFEPMQDGMHAIASIARVALPACLFWVVIIPSSAREASQLCHSHDDYDDNKQG
ncbi:hypothetical protein OE88DRAFT_1038610 [Heliocybe sulcata]|uniref:Uncharacterized protein n=1 Tax=Heliocybe sulcata TaxID=5364 RepID=A0A5C3ML91_9AGAM|nr:hypothetical protein OE88DRAFT_1038610 [Heliocybe sulcata]